VARTRKPRKRRTPRAGGRASPGLPEFAPLDLAGEDAPAGCLAPDEGEDGDEYAEPAEPTEPAVPAWLTFPDDRLRDAWLADRSGDPQVALRLLEEVIAQQTWDDETRRDESFIVAFSHLDDIRAGQGDDVRRFENLRRWTAAAPYDPEAWARLGEMLDKTGRASEAGDAWRHALECGGDDPFVHMNYADRCEERGDWKGCAKHALRAIRLFRGTRGGFPQELVDDLEMMLGRAKRHSARNRAGRARSGARVKGPR